MVVHAAVVERTVKVASKAPKAGRLFHVIEDSVHVAFAAAYSRNVFVPEPVLRADTRKFAVAMGVVCAAVPTRR
jgi:hypothetical protein